MNDALQQFQILKTKLVADKERIQNRLAAINAVLEGEPSSIQNPAAVRVRKASGYAPRPRTLPAKILKTLEKSASPMRVKDLAAAVKGRAVLVSQACSMLSSKGCLRREGRGKYSLF